MPHKALPRLIAVFFIALILVVSAACAPAPGPVNLPASATAPPSPLPTQALIAVTQPNADPAVNAMAASVSRGAGKVIQVSPGDPQRVVILLEESHAFTLGQVESALILNRLYTRFGVRTIALEGLPEGEKLNLAWAHHHPSFTSGEPITPREDVILQTLAEGDANSVETMGLIYNDVTIAGIDDPTLYAVQPQPAIWSAPYNYLYTIALAEMTDDQIKSGWQKLVDEKDFQAALDYAIRNDAWAYPIRQRLDDQAASAEDWQDAVQQIMARSAELKAAPTGQDVADLMALQDYLKVVMQRSDVMAANLLKVSQASRGKPLPAVVGLMHARRLAEKLRQGGVTLVEIRYNSQVSGSQAGAISADAYARMQKGQSVQDGGTLAAALDGRRKPAPRANQPWYFRQVLARQALQWMLESAYQLLGNQPVDFTGPEGQSDLVKEYMKAQSTSPVDSSLLNTVGIEITPLAYARPTDSKPATLDFTLHLPGSQEDQSGTVALDMKAFKAGPITLEKRLLALQQAFAGKAGKTSPPKGIDPAKWQASSSDTWIRFTSP